MMTNEPSPPQSKINHFPTEILCEIFARCVDDSSARVLMQPNIKIAPMSLCHVCATWRAVVLSIPLFWSHLRFELPLNWKSDGHLAYTWDAELFMRRVEWLRWWRRNLGAIAPCLQVEVRRKGNGQYSEQPLPESACEFLLEFMSSAQYVSVGLLYRYLVRWRMEGEIHPKAHTVVSTWASVFEFDDVWSYNRYLISMLIQNRSTLRSITIENTKFGPQEFMDPLNNWSTLTHISLSRVLIDLDTWFPFIRSLRALQSGSFQLSLQDEDFENYARPSIGILPFLKVFHIDASQHWNELKEYPLKAVFDNLQLPALRKLSLESRLWEWDDPTAFAEIHAALASAPAITQLSLGIAFVERDGPRTDTDASGQTPNGNDITPLAERAPRLERLSFVIDGLQESLVPQFVDRIFASSRWLDLKSPASTVQEVTFVAAETFGATQVDITRWISAVRQFVRDDVLVGWEDEAPAEVRRAVWGW